MQIAVKIYRPSKKRQPAIWYYKLGATFISLKRLKEGPKNSRSFSDPTSTYEKQPFGGLLTIRQISCQCKNSVTNQLTNSLITKSGKDNAEFIAQGEPIFSI